jgi:hypothetical protein
MPHWEEILVESYRLPAAGRVWTFHKVRLRRGPDGKTILPREERDAIHTVISRILLKKTTPLTEAEQAFLDDLTYESL